MAKKKKARPIPTRAPSRALVAAAAEANLRFPEPFFWTTDRIEAIKEAVSDFGAHPLDAKPLTAEPTSSIDFVVEGDSWFNHPYLLDVLDWFNSEQLVFAGSFVPGRTLAEMVERQRYLPSLRAFKVRAVMLSGGGNDLINWGRPEGGVSSIFRDGGGSGDAEAYIDTAQLTAALTALEALLGQFVEDVRGVAPNVEIVTHFYDYIVPKHYPSRPFTAGEWMYPQLLRVNVPENQALRLAIARLVIDAGNESRAAACARHDVTFVDLRGTVKGRWFDEIHPKNAAFHDIADRLVAAV